MSTPPCRPVVGDRVEVSYFGTGTVVRLWDDGNVQVRYDPGQYEAPDGLPVEWSGPPSLLTPTAPLRVNDTVSEGDWCECPGTTRRHFRTPACPVTADRQSDDPAPDGPQ